MMAGKGDLQLNMGSQPWWGHDIPHIHQVLPSSQIRKKTCTGSDKS
jgi:hypothetical protein